jgi:5-methylcytosine-specific restriction endonuclease McrA
MTSSWARKTHGTGWRASQWRALAASQGQIPAELLSREGHRYWWFEDCFYWEDEDLNTEDLLALVRDRERRQRRKIEHAHALMVRAAAPPTRHRSIPPRELRLAVHKRNGGCCVECQSTFDLQYDHIIPVAMGGATTFENLQLLCASCNKRKGATLG